MDFKRANLDHLRDRHGGIPCVQVLEGKENQERFLSVRNCKKGLDSWLL